MKVKPQSELHDKQIIEALIQNFRHMNIQISLCRNAIGRTGDRILNSTNSNSTKEFYQHMHFVDKINKVEFAIDSVIGLFPDKGPCEQKNTSPES